MKATRERSRLLFANTLLSDFGKELSCSGSSRLHFMSPLCKMMNSFISFVYISYLCTPYLCLIFFLNQAAKDLF